MSLEKRPFPARLSPKPSQTRQGPQVHLSHRMNASDYQAIFELSPNAYMILDRELRFVAANAAYVRATGTALDRLLGRNLFEAFPHDPRDPRNENAQLLRGSLERVLALRAPDVIAFIPYRVPRERNGEITLEERFWSATHTPILDENGDVRLILQHTVDVTELHKAQEGAADRRDELGVLQRARRVQEANYTLDAERQHLRRLFEQAPGFVAVLAGSEHVFELVNAAYRQLIGHREVVGQSVREALPEVADQGFFQVLDHVFTTAQPFVGRGMAVRLERHPGAGLDEVFVDFVYQPIVDASGTVTGIFVQGHDITAQKQLEVEREALLERQRFLTEAIPQHVWTADVAGELISVNLRVLEYFGVTEEQVLGSGWQRFVHPDDLEPVLRRWTDSLRTEHEYEIEFRLRRADGAYRWHLGRAVAMHDASGAVSRWFGTNTDIDDRKRAQDELLERSAYEQQLIGIVSHDLRNPINAIGIGAALLLKQDQLNGLQAKAAARIASSADRARRMLRDFLDFTQARSTGRIPVMPGPANIRQIARHVFDELRVLHPDRPATIEHGGEAEGTFDADRIAQVIGNLLGNAFQHGSAATPVQLRTRGEFDSVVIEVQNQGAPIPPEDIARFFQPFERGAGSVASAERSVGLGLFISKQIVAAHHGTIGVRSTREEGTVFTVLLPRNPQHVSAATAHDAGIVDATPPRC
jgi:PAS domain S-box-containing protein